MAKILNKEYWIDYIGQWVDYAAYKCGIIFYFGKPDPPAAPDYTGAAIAQGQNNVDTARLQGQLNNPNVITPYGSRSVTFNGDQPTVAEYLSPGEQDLYDKNLGIKDGLLDLSQSGMDRVGNTMDTAWDTSGAPEVTAYGDLDNSNQVAAALRERYQPAMDERRQQGMDALLQQGHGRGGDAWNTQSRDFDQTENDFNLAAIVQSENEKRANDSAQLGAETADRGRYIQEQAYNRNVPLNEVNALRTGNQVTPYAYQGYTPTNVQSAPLFDAALGAGNNAQQNFQNQSGQYGDFWSGVGQVGAAGVNAWRNS